MRLLILLATLSLYLIVAIGCSSYQAAPPRTPRAAPREAQTPSKIAPSASTHRRMPAKAATRSRPQPEPPRSWEEITRLPVEQRSAEAKRLFTAKDVWDAPGFAALYLNDEGMLDANVKGKVIVVRGAVERIESRGVPNAVYLGTRDRESTVGCHVQCTRSGLETWANEKPLWL